MFHVEWQQLCNYLADAVSDPVTGAAVTVPTGPLETFPAAWHEDHHLYVTITGQQGCRIASCSSTPSLLCYSLAKSAAAQSTVPIKVRHSKRPSIRHKPPSS